MRPYHAWINQPSTSDYLHQYHGTRVIVCTGSDGILTAYFADKAVSVVARSDALSPGWPEHLLNPDTITARIEQRLNAIFEAHPKYKPETPHDMRLVVDHIYRKINFTDLHDHIDDLAHEWLDEKVQEQHRMQIISAFSKLSNDEALTIISCATNLLTSRRPSSNSKMEILREVARMNEEEIDTLSDFIVNHLSQERHD